MPYEEYLSWVKYREKYGCLNSSHALQKSNAYLAKHYFNGRGFKISGRDVKMDDLMFYTFDEEIEGGVDEAFALLSSVAGKKDGK